MKRILLLLPLAAVCLIAADKKAGAPQPPCCKEGLPAGKFSEKSAFSLKGKWTSDHGREITLDILRGRPVVLALFFTDCQHSCPFILSDMKEIETKLPAAIREKTNFVLASIDPKRDTVAALRAYREKNHLPVDRWVLLRGEPSSVKSLADHIGFNYVPGSENQFAHSLLITVLNPDGEVIHQQAGLGVDRSGAVKAIGESVSGKPGKPGKR
jgi:protein SCO1